MSVTTLFWFFGENGVRSYLPSEGANVAAMGEPQLDQLPVQHNWITKLREVREPRREPAFRGAHAATIFGDNPFATMVPRYCAVAPLDGPCCTSRAHPDRSTIPGITREGFAESPSECEATCFATTGCYAFSHSVKRRQCVFCSDCAGARQTSAKSRGVFTGWRRQREGETFATLVGAPRTHSGLRFWPGQISAGNVSRTVAAAQAGACVTPRPCAAGAMAVAIVLRGRPQVENCPDLAGQRGPSG